MSSTDEIMKMHTVAISLFDGTLTSHLADVNMPIHTFFVIIYQLQCDQTPALYLKGVACAITYHILL